jgi:hypothetical protein
MSTKTKAKNEVATEESNEIITDAPELPILGEVIGDFDNDDMQFTKFQIAQKVGGLSDNFNFGDMVLEGEKKIGDFNSDPLSITVMRMEKTFEENLPFGGDEMPRVAQSKSEVYAMEGTLGWSSDDNGNRIPPTFVPVCKMFLCIEAPKGESDVKWFPFTFRDTEDNVRHFTFAEWTLRKTAYYGAVTPIASAAKTYMKNGLMYGSFDLSTEKKVFSGNGVAVPRIGRGGLHSRELVQWLSEWV